MSKQEITIRAIILQCKNCRHNHRGVCGSVESKKISYNRTQFPPIWMVHGIKPWCTPTEDVTRSPAAILQTIGEGVPR